MLYYISIQTPCLPSGDSITLKTSIKLVNLVNLVREEFETRDLESHKRVKPGKSKNDEEVY